MFSSLNEAVTVVGILREHGLASIDIGCFQINLLYHPTAFKTIAQGFDPLHNADYAARFLRALYARSGDWNTAVADYHSAEPDRGVPYRRLVFRAWRTPRSYPFDPVYRADPDAHVIHLSDAVPNMIIYTSATLPMALRVALGVKMAAQ